ncbi:hypothetical protein RKD05_001905 [Microbacterium sp. SLBN-111]
MKVKKPNFSVYQAPAIVAPRTFSPALTRVVTSTVSCTSRSRYDVHPGDSTSSLTGVPLISGSATPSAVQNSTALRTGRSRWNVVRTRAGCAGAEASARPIGSATHSPSPRNPATTGRGALHGLVPPSVPVTRTRTSRRSPGASGRNGQSTRTEASPSTATVSMPSVSSART